MISCMISFHLSVHATILELENADKIPNKCVFSYFRHDLLRASQLGTNTLNLTDYYIGISIKIKREQ